MRALLPRPEPDVDLLGAYAVATPPGAARPFVRATMISSLDGAVSVGGRSGALGGAADREVFGVLRSLADVVLVGAGTVRAEGYGPVRLGDGLRAARARRGQLGVPPLAVVTRTGRLDWGAPLFAAAESRPIVYTPAGAAEGVRRRAAAGAAADVVAAGEGRVDPHLVLGDLFARGHRSVLLEGGPELNASFAEAGVIDELCLTVAPCLAGGAGPGVLGAAALEHPVRTTVVHLLESDGYLFYRLALAGSGACGPGSGG